MFRDDKNHVFPKVHYEYTISNYETEKELNIVERPMVKIIIFKCNSFTDYTSTLAESFHYIYENCIELNMNLLIIFVPFSLQPQSNALNKLTDKSTKEESKIYNRLCSEFNLEGAECQIFYPNITKPDYNKWTTINDKMIELCFDSLNNRITIHKADYLQCLYKYHNIDDLSIHLTPILSPLRDSNLSAELLSTTNTTQLIPSSLSLPTSQTSPLLQSSSSTSFHSSPILLNRNIPGNILFMLNISSDLNEVLHTYNIEQIKSSPTSLPTSSSEIPLNTNISKHPSLSNKAISKSISNSRDSPISFSADSGSDNEDNNGEENDDDDDNAVFTPTGKSMKKKNNLSTVSNIVLSEFYHQCELLNEISEENKLPPDLILDETTSKELKLHKVDSLSNIKSNGRLNQLFEFLNQFLPQITNSGFSIPDDYGDLVQVFENMKLIFKYYYDNIPKKYRQAKKELKDILFCIREHLKKYNEKGVKSDYVQDLLIDTLLSGFKLCSLYKNYGIFALPLSIYSDLFDLILQNQKTYPLPVTPPSTIISDIIQLNNNIHEFYTHSNHDKSKVNILSLLVSLYYSKFQLYYELNISNEMITQNILKMLTSFQLFYFTTVFILLYILIGFSNRF